MFELSETNIAPSAKFHIYHENLEMKNERSFLKKSKWSVYNEEYAHMDCPFSSSTTLNINKFQLFIFAIQLKR